MRFAIVGSGAVGGYYGALLARAGHEVAFIARGAHLEAIRARGLAVRGPLGDFVVRAQARGRHPPRSVPSTPSCSPSRPTTTTRRCRCCRRSCTTRRWS